MELIKAWVIGVTGAAMLVAIADSLTPGGAIKKIGKLTGGVVLLLALLSPVKGLDYGALSLALAEGRGELSDFSGEEAGLLGTQMMKTIIAEKTSAYILDKANDLGVTCTAQVECRVGGENLPYPAAVTVSGTMTERQQESLSRILEADLAIPAEMQTFIGGDVE